MGTDYYEWSDASEEGYCVLDHIKNYEDTFRLYDGSRLGDEFPRDVFFPMNPDHPNDIRLADSIPNFNSSIVVSNRLKELVESQQPADVEYLNVSIHDHKGRVASSEYFVLNPYRVVDCLDVDASEVRWNRISKDRISSCRNPVFHFDTVDDDLLLFRVQHHPSTVLVAQRLVDLITQEGLVGPRFTPTSQLRRL